MNRNIHSSDQGNKKLNQRKATGPDKSYMQRFMDISHKDLEVALEKKLNIAFNNRKIKTPKKGFEAHEYDRDTSPNYFSPVEKAAEKKSKKKSPRSPRNPKTKVKSQTTGNAQKAGKVKESQATPKEAVINLQDSKIKEGAHDVPKRTKVKGPNTLLNKEPIVEPIVVTESKKAKDPNSVMHKNKMKEMPSKPSHLKKETHSKGEKGEKKGVHTTKKGLAKNSTLKNLSKKV